MAGVGFVRRTRDGREVHRAVELRRPMFRRFTLPMMGALLLLVSGTASTQTTYGLIEGSITDATGGALHGATVTVTQPTTGFVRTIVTNELGLYRALNLHPAEYDVTVELSGFATVTRRSVKIDIGQAVALNFVMAGGQARRGSEGRAATGRHCGDPGDQQHDRQCGASTSCR